MDIIGWITAVYVAVWVSVYIPEKQDEPKQKTTQSASEVTTSR